ncbi:MAG TPA: dTMP kinase [Solirubrobacterales bacterium]|nr:dTMP kinase [Solirubrobacterales bacterium]
MFITLEGIDRAGKTTQAARLADALGPGTLLLREPGGTPAGERIRDLIKDPELELSPAAELLLFNAARSQLVNEVVMPALEGGRDVVCDRFIDSTVAYQGVARDLGIDRVEDLTRLVVGSCMPDLTLLLRVDPERAFYRQTEIDDRFEAEGVEFQRRVAAAYDELARRHPERIVVVDGERDPGAVHERVMEAVRERRG